MSSLIASGARHPGLSECQDGQLVVGDDVVDHGSFVDDRADVEQTADCSHWTRVGLDASEQEQ